MTLPFPASSKAHLKKSYLLGPENHLLPVVIDDFLAAEARFSPSVIYGPPGSGKTHLAELLAAQWNVQAREADSITITQATDMFATAHSVPPNAQRSHSGISHSSTSHGDISQSPSARIKQAGNHAPVVFLNVDDLARNSRWQKRMCELLDDWSRSARQVLLTSRLHPGELAEFTPRLRSRLVSGLCVGLEPPSEETRLALLEHWSQADSVAISHAALQELAAQVPGVPARLRGAFWRLVAWRHEQKPAAWQNEQSSARRKAALPEISVDDVRRFLHGAVDDRTRVEVAVVAKATARYFGITLADIRGPSRRKSTVQARSVAMYLSRHLTGKSLAEIGKHFSGRDHTTVLHSCRKIETQRDEDQTISEAIRQLTELLTEDA